MMLFGFGFVDKSVCKLVYTAVLVAASPLTPAGYGPLLKEEGTLDRPLTLGSPLIFWSRAEGEAAR